MEAIRTDNYGGVSNVLESMETGINMLDAFAQMLGYTLNTGDDQRPISFGAESIIRQQCQDLEFIRTALREQFDTLRREKLAIKDINDVARLAGVPVCIAERCVHLATGIAFHSSGKLDPVQPDVT